MSDAIAVALIAAVPATLAVLVGLRTKSKVHDLHLIVNSRLTELLERTAEASRAEGVAVEREAGAMRAAETAVASARVTADHSAHEQAAAEKRTPERETS